MTSSVYLTGTVSVSGGNAVVTGTGTAWSVALVTGGMFSFAGMSVPIASVESDTSLTLAYPWPGATAAGAYAIARETSEAVRAAWINDRLAQILTKLSLAGIHPDGAGTLAERDALSPVPAAGFLWLRVETGFALAFYKRTGSGWDGPFSLKGDDGDPGPPGGPGPQGADGDVTWEGAWASGVNYTANQAISHGGSSYVATSNHLSAAANEPGVGVNWATVWDLMAAKGGQGNPGNDGMDGVVQSVVAGSNITVDNTDPAHPVVSSSATGVTDGDKGDIVVSGGGTAWAVDSNAVTYAKMQDVSVAARILGRKTAGAGDVEELTLSDVLDMIGSATPGDILFRGGSGWSRLPKGTAGQYLKQNTALTAPEWVTVAERELLTANRTYYVRTDGSDTNNGLSNTAGGAFLTIQKAYSTALTIDFNGFNVTISVADGTYTSGLLVDKNWVGGSLILTGSTSAIISMTSNHAIATVTPLGNLLSVVGLKLETTGAGDCIRNSAGGTIWFTGTEFGACAGIQLNADAAGAIVECRGAYTLTGGAVNHIVARYGGFFRMTSRTLTVTGTPAFSSVFALATSGGVILSNGSTITGSATGKRYQADVNAVINTGGGGANYFPGGVAGTVATGGQYV